MDAIATGALAPVPTRRGKLTITPRRAVVLALAAYTFWVLADTSLKLASPAGLSAPETIALVGLFEALLLLVYAIPRGTIRSLWPREPHKQFLRSLLDLANNLCVVVALRHLPLALFYILVFAAPIVTVLLAALFLGESLDLRRSLAIVIGFAGVVIAVHPSRTGWQPGYAIGYLACLVCVLCFSTNIVWSRILTQNESPESMTFFSGLVMLTLGTALALHHPHPIPLKTAATLASTALFSIGGSFCFFIALRHTTTANVVPFHYTQLLTGAALAFAIWHERPTLFMWSGAVLIAGAGYYTASLSRSSTAAEEPIHGPVA